jgi:prolyl oligopeptidase
VLKRGVEVSDCGDYLIMSISKSCDTVNQLWYFDLKKANYVIGENLPFTKLADNFDAQYTYITNEGSLFIFKSNKNAPKYNLISIDVNETSSDLKWNVLVAEKSDDVLQTVGCVNKTKLLLNYMHDCKVYEARSRQNG